MAQKTPQQVPSSPQQSSSLGQRPREATRTPAQRAKQRLVYVTPSVPHTGR